MAQKIHTKMAAPVSGLTIVIHGVLLLLLTSIVTSQVSNPHHQELDKWTMQLIELKMLVTSLDAKFSALASKVSNFQVLEYAFKVNAADSYLRNIETKLNQMDAELKIIKETSRTSGCPQWKQIEGGSHQEPRSSNQRDTHFEKRFEDYMAKATKSHQLLEELAQEQKTTLGKVQDIVRTGFSKLYEKLEKSLAIEGHVSRMTQIVTGLPTRLSQISDQLLDTSNEITEVKTDVLRNEALITSNKNNNSVVSHLITYVLNLGEDFKTKLSSFENLKQELVSISNLTEHVNDNLNDRNGVLDLIKAIEIFSNKTSPLLLSVPATFDDIYGVLRKIGDEMVGNTTSCGYSKMFTTELKKFSRGLMKKQLQSDDFEEDVNIKTLPRSQVLFLRRCMLRLQKEDKSKALGIFG